MELRTIGLTEEQESLAEVAYAFVRRAQLADGAISDRVDSLRAGVLPPSWQEVVSSGLHTTHLAEAVGGAGGTIAEIAVVIEQFSGALYCGPLVPTVLAGALMQEVGAADAVGRIVAGEPAAVVNEPSIRASAIGDSLVLSGRAEVVLGAPFATQFFVRVELSDTQTSWAVITRDMTGVEVVPQESFDVTQPVGTVILSAVRITAGEVLTGLTVEKAERITQALYAADAVGVSAETTTRGVEHAQLRTQFRKKLSEFQVVQHRLANMYVREQQARAVAWDLSQDLTESAEQDALVSRTSVLIALENAVTNAYEYVITLGAMGFTWEHPAHLFWRRATQLLALSGPVPMRELELGRIGLNAQRTIRIVEPGERTELRAEVQAALRTAGDPLEGVIPGSAWAPRRGSSWQRMLASRRLVSPQLPEPYGRGADLIDQAVILEEFEKAGLKPPTLVIGDWVVPTILAHGTEEQQKQFIPPSLSSDIMWCQLFSEPGAGSDLGSIATRGVKVEGGWKVSGQKIWNTLADVADWGALLLRTDADSAGSRGLSYLLVDMYSPGLTVRPIVQATGQAEFCEVFFDEVFVPDNQMVGQSGEGWKIATTTLANERLRMGEELGHGSSRRFKNLIERSPENLQESGLRALGRAVARESALTAMSARGARRGINGGATSLESGVQKLANILAQETGSRDLMQHSGPAAVLETRMQPHADYGDLLDYLGIPAIVFGGGTPDIQLTVIARKVLGL